MPPLGRPSAGVAAGEAGEVEAAIQHYQRAVRFSGRACIASCARPRQHAPVPGTAGAFSCPLGRLPTPTIPSTSSARNANPHPNAPPPLLQVELSPRYAEAWCNMGVLLRQQVGRGRGGQAERAAGLVVLVWPAALPVMPPLVVESVLCGGSAGWRSVGS